MKAGHTHRRTQTKAPKPKSRPHKASKRSQSNNRAHQPRQQASQSAKQLIPAQPLPIESFAQVAVPSRLQAFQREKKLFQCTRNDSLDSSEIIDRETDGLSDKSPHIDQVLVPPPPMSPNSISPQLAYKFNDKLGALYTVSGLFADIIDGKDLPTAKTLKQSAQSSQKAKPIPPSALTQPKRTIYTSVIGIYHLDIIPNSRSLHNKNPVILSPLDLISI